ncbi:hypothetical protein BDM02DRAFT_3133148 [Thelephora ganbajun]|uniref:Uncharacterized protein n=1 Tax=Thelephora ganbajun TaxID=370292 RepID=A0ACB6YYS4_THEGA|nr:hypothetical protein BDM02DRAFT_3133148 [Thelephora ganbajun]
MDPNLYSKPYYPAYGGLDSQQPRQTGFSSEPHQSSDQYWQYPLSGFASHHVPTDYPPTTTLYNPLGVLPARDNWHQFQARTYAEKATQTIQSDPASEGNKAQGRPQAYQRATPGELVPQETYKSPRQQTEFPDSDTIVFTVGGKEGIRLSDASEGNWVGFEGGEDRSLFDGNRLQIMNRLHADFPFKLVGCSPWNSKIATTDFTAKRRPITRRKLAAEVAKSVKKFIAREKLNGHSGGHPRCNWGDASLKNVFLTRMVRVSSASWQPELFVERPSVASQAAASSSSGPSPPRQVSKRPAPSGPPSPLPPPSPVVRRGGHLHRCPCDGVLTYPQT